MAFIRHEERTQSEFLERVPLGKIREPLAGTLGSVSSLLRNSTVGVALFDRNLHCRAFNGALRRMIGVSQKRPIGKQLHQIFPDEAPKLEIAFRQVWATGNSVSNLELTAPLPAEAGPRRWVINFYPITDESGQVRLVAITLCEVTKGRYVELKLSRLRDKFQSNILRQPNLLEEEFARMSVQTFELVNRSVALLKSSLSLRFYTSETRLEAALVRHALHMTGNRVSEPAFSGIPPQSDSGTVGTCTSAYSTPRTSSPRSGNR